MCIKLQKNFQGLNIAQGSISEIDTQIELSFILSFIEKNLYNDLMDELNTISKMLFGLLRSLK